MRNTALRFSLVLTVALVAGGSQGQPPSRQDRIGLPTYFRGAVGSCRCPASQSNLGRARR